MGFGEVVSFSIMKVSECVTVWLLIFETKIQNVAEITKFL